VGGTKIAACLADRMGRSIAREHIPTPARPRDAMHSMIAMGARLLERGRGRAGRGARGRASLLRAVGLCVPGPLAPDGMLLAPPNMPLWRRVDLAAPLGRAFRVPVRVENDANAAALAEGRFGAARGLTDFLYLTLSTGVGGGIVCGGRLLRGRTGNAGEVGHQIVRAGGPRCGCGRRGCLEAIAGGAALARRLRRSVRPGTILWRLARGRRRDIDARLWVRALGLGDPLARRVADDFVAALSTAVANLVFTLDPQAVILGTIVARSGKALLPRLRREVRRKLWPVYRPGLRILASPLGERQGERAALAAALEALREDGKPGPGASLRARPEQAPASARERKVLRPARGAAPSDRRRS
jgi:glucokinase